MKRHERLSQRKYSVRSSATEAFAKATPGRLTLESTKAGARQDRDEVWNGSWRCTGVGVEGLSGYNEGIGSSSKKSGI